MSEYGEADYLEPLNRTPDSVVIDNISVRECMDIRQPDPTDDRLVMIYGENQRPGQNLVWAESPGGDLTQFQNTETVFTATHEQSEDPNWFYDPETETLHLYYESHANPNKVGVLNAETLEGKNYTNEITLGGSDWDLERTFNSPTVWRHNDSLYMAGEEHDSGIGNLFIAKGSGPRTWNDYVIAAKTNDYSSIDNHINLQTMTIDRNGRIHGYTNNLQSDGEWASRYMTTESYDTNGFPSEPWSISSDRITSHNIGLIYQRFNERHVYGSPTASNDKIEYWELSGSVIERSLSSSGGSVEWEYYEPTVPVGSTIEWRVAVEDTSGNIDRSETLAFDVVDDVTDGTGPPAFAVRTASGARQTNNAVVDFS
ncbi:hypothetical protein ACFQO4_20570 [Saliphagus sp. GCM10025334]